MDKEDHIAGAERAGAAMLIDECDLAFQEAHQLKVPEFHRATMIRG